MAREYTTGVSERTVRGAVRSSIMQHIMQNGTFMVPEIASATGFSLTTVAKYVSEMLAAGEIIEMDRICLHAKGRRTVRYGVQPEACAGRSTRCAIVSSNSSPASTAWLRSVLPGSISMFRVG